jgi:hypothetical protein
MRRAKRVADGVVRPVKHFSRLLFRLRPIGFALRATLSVPSKEASRNFAEVHLSSTRASERREYSHCNFL